MKEIRQTIIQPPYLGLDKKFSPQYILPGEFPVAQNISTDKSEAIEKLPGFVKEQDVRSPIWDSYYEGDVFPENNPWKPYTYTHYVSGSSTYYLRDIIDSQYVYYHIEGSGSGYARYSQEIPFEISETGNDDFNITIRYQIIIAKSADNRIEIKTGFPHFHHKIYINRIVIGTPDEDSPETEISEDYLNNLCGGDWRVGWHTLIFKYHNKELSLYLDGHLYEETFTLSNFEAPPSPNNMELNFEAVLPAFPSIATYAKFRHDYFRYTNKEIAVSDDGQIYFPNEISWEDEILTAFNYQRMNGQEELLLQTGDKLVSTKDKIDYNVLKSGLQLNIPLRYDNFHDWVYISNGIDYPFAYNGSFIIDFSKVCNKNTEIDGVNYVGVAGKVADGSYVSKIITQGNLGGQQADDWWTGFGIQLNIPDEEPEIAVITESKFITDHWELGVDNPFSQIETNYIFQISSNIPKGAVVKTHRDVLYLANIPDNPSALRWHNIDLLPNSFNAWDEINVLDLGFSNYGEIRGLYSYNDKLVIFKSDSIVIATDTEQGAIIWHTIDKFEGLDMQETIAEKFINGQKCLVFLANDGIYMMGQNFVPTKISDKIEPLVDKIKKQLYSYQQWRQSSRDDFSIASREGIDIDSVPGQFSLKEEHNIISSAVGFQGCQLSNIEVPEEKEYIQLKRKDFEQGYWDENVQFHGVSILKGVYIVYQGFVIDANVMDDIDPHRCYKVKEIQIYAGFWGEGEGAGNLRVKILQESGDNSPGEEVSSDTGFIHWSDLPHDCFGSAVLVFDNPVELKTNTKYWFGVFREGGDINKGEVRILYAAADVYGHGNPYGPGCRWEAGVHLMEDYLFIVRGDYYPNQGTCISPAIQRTANTQWGRFIATGEDDKKGGEGGELDIGNTGYEFRFSSDGVNWGNWQLISDNWKIPTNDYDYVQWRITLHPINSGAGTPRAKECDLSYFYGQGQLLTSIYAIGELVSFTTFNADFIAPGSSSVRFFIKGADTEAGVLSAVEYEVIPNVYGNIPVAFENKYIQIRVVLASSDVNRLPIVFAFSIGWIYGEAITYINKAVSFDDRYLLSVEGLGEERERLIIALDKNNCWHLYDGFNVEVWAIYSRDLYFIKTDGYGLNKFSKNIYVWETEGIDSYFETPDILGQYKQNYNMYRDLYVWFEPQNQGTLTIYYAIDNDIPSAESDNLEHWQRMDKFEIDMTQPSPVRVAFPLGKVGLKIRFLVRNNEVETNFKVKSMDLAYYVLEREV